MSESFPPFSGLNIKTSFETTTYKMVVTPIFLMAISRGYDYFTTFTSSTAQGGGGSFKIGNL